MIGTRAGAALLPARSSALAVPDRLPVDATISASTRARLERAVPENTSRAYRGDLDRFGAWCEQVGRTPLPATVGTLTEYVAHLADQGKAPATIRRALAAIRAAHRNAGQPVPDTAGPLYVLREHRRSRAAAGAREDKAAPLTVATLRALVEQCDPSTLTGLRDRALLVLGFAIAARRSELVALDLADVREVTEGLLVRIRWSKTDQDAAGVDVAVPYASHLDTCPVRTVRAYRAALAAQGVTEGPLFRRVDRHGVLGRAANGRGSSDGRLSGQAVGLILRRLAERAGVPDVAELSAHSLRAGFATETYRAGADTLSIGRQGRWKDGSPVLLGYIRSVDRWARNPLAGVL